MAPDLTTEVRKLNAQLGELRTEVAKDYVPRAEQNRRRRRAVTLVLVAMAGSLLVNNGAITRCFIGGPPVGVERALCGLAFPGYEQMRRTSDQRLQQFTELLRVIPQNQQGLAELKTRVEELERKGR
jgi:hypothetical protein